MAHMSKKEMTVGYAIDNLMDNGMMPNDFNQNVRNDLNTLYDKLAADGSYVSSSKLADAYRTQEARRNRKNTKKSAR